MNKKLILTIVYIIFLAAILFIIFRYGGSANGPDLSISENTEPVMWVVTSGESRYFFMLPDSLDPIRTEPVSEILTYWNGGFLRRFEGVTEWYEWDSETSQFIADPGVDLTEWENPVAVDGDGRIIYAFEHTAPPVRKVSKHLLDGTEPETVITIAAEEVELIAPLPSNGWPVFWVDRPSQAGAVTVNDEPTRKLRIQRDGNVGGEVPDSLGFYFLEDNLVVNREEEGWILYEPRASSISQRTMSIDTIEGDLTPLERVYNTILISADTTDDSGANLSTLYSYEIYATRTIREIWNTSVLDFEAHIMNLAVLGSDEYYIIVGRMPELRNIVLIHYRDGEWSEIVASVFPEPVTDADIFLLDSADPGSVVLEDIDEETGPIEDLRAVDISDKYQISTGEAELMDVDVVPANQEP